MNQPAAPVHYACNGHKMMGFPVGGCVCVSDCSRYQPHSNGLSPRGMMRQLTSMFVPDCAVKMGCLFD